MNKYLLTGALFAASNVLGMVSSIDINSVDGNGNSPLHLVVVRAKNKNEVTSLLNHGADINQKNREGDFPTKMAFMCDKFKLVKYLIKHGANINQQDRYGNTLLHLASLENNEKMLKYLIQHGAEINIENNFGQTALHLSIQWGNEKMIECLINHKADINKRDKNGCTPLDIAAKNEKLLEYLKGMMLNRSVEKSSSFRHLNKGGTSF